MYDPSSIKRVRVKSWSTKTNIFLTLRFHNQTKSPFQYPVLSFPKRMSSVSLQHTFTFSSFKMGAATLHVLVLVKPGHKAFTYLALKAGSRSKPCVCCSRQGSSVLILLLLKWSSNCLFSKPLPRFTIEDPTRSSCT